MRRMLGCRAFHSPGWCSARTAGTGYPLASFVQTRHQILLDFDLELLREQAQVFEQHLEVARLVPQLELDHVVLVAVKAGRLFSMEFSAPTDTAASTAGSSTPADWAAYILCLDAPTLTLLGCSRVSSISAWPQLPLRGTEAWLAAL